MDIKLLIGGALLVGIGIGAYALLVKPDDTANIAPSQPEPKPLTNPIATDSDVVKEYWT